MTIQLIEEKIRIMNDDAFHRLVDHYLFYEYANELELINPIGQAEGRQKSRAGTPDTRIELANGKYVFIQYTTQAAKKKSDFLKKLKTDLTDCFDPKKTHLQTHEIDHIILCYNSNPPPEIEPELREIARKKLVPLELVNLHTLCQRIYRYHPHLAHEYLGIEIDTYQLLPLDLFIRQYQKGGIATPLSNPILHREEELANIQQSLATYTVTVLKGKQGTGKSRLAVEAVKQFALHSGRIGYCITNKQLAVINDLRKYISPSEDYLLFIDDANKSIHHLKEALAYCTESGATIRIILTVRDYAFGEIKSLVEPLNCNKIEVLGLTDEQLKAVIKSEPFNITKSRVADRILRMSHGNPRMAIMIALQSEDAELGDLNNLWDVYERYFQRLNLEHGNFLEPANLAILGLLALFKVIDREEPITEKVLSAFNISANDFWTRIHDLDKFEIVDLYADGPIVKISDQILTSYALYRCFFKDRVLSYEVILNTFFPTHHAQLGESTIEMVNTFGYEALDGQIKPLLSKRYQQGWLNEDEKHLFLKTFWFYLTEEALDYVNSKIDDLPDKVLVLADRTKYVNSDTRLVLEEDTILKQDEKDPLLDIIGLILRAISDQVELAIELLLLLVKKRPELSEHVSKLVEESLAFNHEIPEFWQYREAEFNKQLAVSIHADESHLRYLFFRLSPHYLKTHFRSNRFAGRNRVALGHVDIALSQQIQEIRKFYWQQLIVFFPAYPTLCTYTLTKVVDGYWVDFHREVAEFDQPFILQLFNGCLNLDDLQHLLIIREYSVKITKRGVICDELSTISARSKKHWKYKWYIALDWDLLQNRNRYDIERDGEDHETFRKRFDKLKKQELLTTFRLKTQAQFVRLFEFILECVDAKARDFHNIESSTSILFTQFLKESREEFLLFLEKVLPDERFLTIVRSDKIFAEIIEADAQLIPRLETFLANSHPALRLNFYESIPDAYFSVTHYAQYSKTLKNFSGNLNLALKRVERVSKYEDQFLANHLTILLERAKSGKCSFFLWSREFIIVHYEELRSQPKLVRDLYLHLDLEQDIFDTDSLQFLFLFRNDPQFFLDYLKTVTGHNRLRRQEHRHLNALWKEDNFVHLFTEIFDTLLSQRDTFWRIENFLENLLERASDIADFNERKLQFFTSYLRKYFATTSKMKVAFRLINGKLFDHKETLTLEYLKLNQNFDDFKAINWTDDGVVLHSGNFIRGDRDARIYRRLKELIDSLGQKRRFIRHQLHLNTCIDWAERSAAYDRRSNFGREY